MPGYNKETIIRSVGAAYWPGFSGTDLCSRPWTDVGDIPSSANLCRETERRRRTGDVNILSRWKRNRLTYSLNKRGWERGLLGGGAWGKG